MKDHGLEGKKNDWANERCISYKNDINNISISAKISNSTLVFLKSAYHANPGDERNRTGSSLYILRHIFREFSNTSANNNVIPEHKNHDILLNLLFQNLYKLFLSACNLHH